MVDPFTFQRKEGVEPPLTSVALNVTVMPAHTGFTEGVTETLTGKRGLTVMVTTFETAGLPVAQVALEIRTHEIVLLSLLSSATKV